MKEADTLESRVLLMEHCSQLMTPGRMKVFPRHELTAHVSAVVNAGLQLSFDTRCPLFERVMDDKLNDILQAKDDRSSTNANIDKYLGAHTAWANTDGIEVDEMNPTVAEIIAGYKDEIHPLVTRGIISSEEAEEKMKANSKDWLTS